MVLGSGSTLMSKRKAIPAFMAYMEDLTGQSGEDSQRASKSEIAIM